MFFSWNTLAYSGRKLDDDKVSVSDPWMMNVDQEGIGEGGRKKWFQIHSSREMNDQLVKRDRMIRSWWTPLSLSLPFHLMLFLVRKDADGQDTKIFRPSHRTETKSRKWDGKVEGRRKLMEGNTRQRHFHGKEKFERFIAPSPALTSLTHFYGVKSQEENLSASSSLSNLVSIQWKDETESRKGGGEKRETNRGIDRDERKRGRKLHFETSFLIFETEGKVVGEWVSVRVWVKKREIRTSEIKFSSGEREMEGWMKGEERQCPTERKIHGWLCIISLSFWPSVRNTFFTCY